MLKTIKAKQKHFVKTKAEMQKHKKQLLKHKAGWRENKHRKRILPTGFKDIVVHIAMVRKKQMLLYQQSTFYFKLSFN